MTVRKKRLPHLVSVAPILPWIREKVELETVEGFAERCDISPRRITEMLAGRAHHTSFDNLDKMLAREGSRSVIDFFPEYAEDDFLNHSNYQPKGTKRVAGKRLCSIPECGNTHHAKGFCEIHYRRAFTNPKRRHKRARSS